METNLSHHSSLKEYIEIGRRTVKEAVIFATMYVGKSEVSSYCTIKTKHRNKWSTTVIVNMCIKLIVLSAFLCKIF